MSVASSTHRRQPWRRGAFLIGIGLTLLLALALGPVAAPGLAAGTSTDAETLREQAARDGWVRVRVDLRSDGAAAPAAPLAAARTAVAPAATTDTRAQTVDDLLFALPDGSYRGLAYSAGAGSLTLSVDAAGLDGLLASPLVATVATAVAEEMRRMAAGSFHSLAINPDGSLRAWGSNDSGQLGSGGTPRAFPVQVRFPGPDFAVTRILLTPAGTLTNPTFSAAVTVLNQGSAAGNGGTLAVWTNRAGPPACGSDGNAAGSVGTLAPGAGRTLTFTGLRPGTAGRKTLRAFIDGDCRTAEPNETNNQSTLTYSVAAAVADFVVTRVVLTPGTPRARGTFSAAVTVRNQGRGAGVPRSLRLWPNLAAAPACGASGGRSVALPSLAAGASTTVTLTGLAAGTTAGGRTLRAFVDPACLTGETNETNNQRVQGYTVAH